jgi:hypothetical protein
VVFDGIFWVVALPSVFNYVTRTIGVFFFNEAGVKCSLATHDPAPLTTIYISRAMIENAMMVMQNADSFIKPR